MLIHDRLCGEFGKAFLYLDVDSIPIGVDFTEHLSREVGKCDIMLVIIGKNWLSPRLNDDTDFVRIEIEAALNRRIPAVPVLVEGATLPDETQLPPSLRPLLLMQATRIDSDSRFNGEIETLIGGIKKLMQMPIRKRVMPSLWQRWFAPLKRIRFALQLSSVLITGIGLLAIVTTVRSLRFSPEDVRVEENISVTKNDSTNASPLKNKPAVKPTLTDPHLRKPNLKSTPHTTDTGGQNPLPGRKPVYVLPDDTEHM